MELYNVIQLLIFPKNEMVQSKILFLVTLQTQSKGILVVKAKRSCKIIWVLWFEFEKMICDILTY